MYNSDRVLINNELKQRVSQQNSRHYLKSRIIRKHGKRYIYLFVKYSNFVQVDEYFDFPTTESRYPF